MTTNCDFRCFFYTSKEFSSFQRISKYFLETRFVKICCCFFFINRMTVKSLTRKINTIILKKRRLISRLHCTFNEVQVTLVQDDPFDSDRFHLDNLQFCDKHNVGVSITSVTSSSNIYMYLHDKW